jgi:hypothetical protein
MCDRKSRILIILFTLAVFFFFPVSTEAADGYDLDPFPDWLISGTNTIRAETYATTGDKDSSIYSDRGGQYYNEFNIDFSRILSPFNNLKGSISGVINDSEYRSRNNGLTFERLNLTQENGDFSVPYRLEAGDYFGFYTQRTMQSSLKGLQVDIQPGVSFFGEENSILIHTGSNMPDYKHEDPEDDLYSGISWLVGGKHTHIALNMVRNFKQDQDSTPEREQYVYSVAGDHNWTILDQSLLMNAELAWFTGDLANSSSSYERHNDFGYFLNFKGKSKIPLTYSYRFEQYGEHFQPAGASVSSNRRTNETKAGWKFKNGLRLQGRLQYFEDSLKSDNTTDTKVAGLNLNGPLKNRFLPGLNMGIDGFSQYVADDDKTVKTRTNSVNLNLSAPLWGDLSGRTSFSVLKTKNRLTGSTTSEACQAGFGVTHPISLFGFKGGVDGGISWQKRLPDTQDIGANLGLNLGRGPHRLNASYRTFLEDPVAKGAQGDIWTHSMAFSYAFTMGNHSISLEGNYDERDPELNTDTYDYKIGIAYTITFEKPVRIRESSGRTVIPVLPEGKAVPSTKIFQLADFSLGTNFSDAISRTETRLGGQGVKLPGMVVFETEFYDDIDQRQRLVLVQDKNRLEKVGVIISLLDTGGLDTTEQIYRSLQAALSKRYGAPATYNVGDFSTNLVNEVNAGKFIRNSEWTVSGGKIRLGIPQRLDDTVRIEVQYATSFPQPRQTFWSIEGLR